MSSLLSKIKNTILVYIYTRDQLYSYESSLFPCFHPNAVSMTWTVVAIQARLDVYELKTVAGIPDGIFSNQKYKVG
jgi:hypothetical protein